MAAFNACTCSLVASCDCDRVLLSAVLACDEDFDGLHLFGPPATEASEALLYSPVNGPGRITDLRAIYRGSLIDESAFVAKNGKAAVIAPVFAQGD